MKKYTISHFTLVELLVAMAVLVVMMGFLFDFVIGAQKVWSGSSNANEQFQQPNAVFEYLTRDLQNAYISDTPEGSAPLYFQESSSSNYIGSENESIWLGFMTRTSPGDTGTDSSKVGCYPVMYHFRRVEEDGATYRPIYKMYRLIMNKNSTSPAISPLELLGKDYPAMTKTVYYNYYTSRFCLLATSSILNSTPPLAENILDCKIEFMFSTPPTWTQYQCTQRPSAVRITLTVFDPSKLNNYNELKQAATAADKTDFEGELQKTARTFSKVIFLR